MMPYASSNPCRQKVTARCLEEIQHGLIFKRWGVRDIHHYLGAGKRSRQSFTGDGVDARRGRGSHDSVTTFTQVVYQLGSDEAAASDDHDLHGFRHFLLFYL